MLFANFAEALAEGRSKAQAATLRGMKQAGHGQKARRSEPTDRAQPSRCAPRSCARVMSCWSKPEKYIPADGEVIEGAASVDESAITGESAPVIRESGGDFSVGHRRHAGAVGLDRRAGSPSIPGETFLDRMIAMVEGAKRQKTPNEIALHDPAGGADAGISGRDRRRCCRSRVYQRGGRASSAPRSPSRRWWRCWCA